MPLPTNFRFERYDPSLIDQQHHSNAPDRSSTDVTPKRIVEARGWVKTSDGHVMLIAQAPTVTSGTPWFTPPSCETVNAIAP